MPELPEVETVCRGLSSNIINKTINEVTINQHQLRFKIPKDLPNIVKGQQIKDIYRRAKYLLFQLDNCYIVWHLGMSGSIWLEKKGYKQIKHDHLLIKFGDESVLRYNDPRRFGLVDYCDNPDEYRLLAHLGLEPLEPSFSPEYLHQQCLKSNLPIKSLLMNNKVVVGVGNIYACESLFHAGVLPTTISKELSKNDCSRIVKSIVQVLSQAIKSGGSTLKDFVNSDGKPGYFQHSFFVYGKTGEPCKKCSHEISTVKLNQRSSFYCSKCQK